jgi:membrane protease YdiL (CAAX protease family)
MQDSEKQPHAALPFTSGPYGIVMLVLFVFFGAEQIGTLFLVQVYPRIRGFNTAATKHWLNSFSVEFWLIAICYPMVLLSLWWWFLRGKRDVQRLLGLVKPKLSNLGWIIIGLVLFYVVTGVAVALLEQFVPSLKANSQLTQQLNISSIHGPLEIVSAVVGLAILDPITEELVFRGFIFTSLKQRMPVVVAALTCSVIFAVPHILENSTSLLYVLGISIFCLSLILCMVRQKTGNIYAGMVIHSVVNATSIVALLHTH